MKKQTLRLRTNDFVQWYFNNSDDFDFFNKIMKNELSKGKTFTLDVNDLILISYIPFRFISEPKGVMDELEKKFPTKEIEETTEYKFDLR